MSLLLGWLFAIRTENNGNLILEDIPIIPQSIKDDLSKFQVQSVSVASD